MASYDWVGISSVITALGVIALGILVPLLNSQNKRRERELEHKIDSQDKEIERKFIQNEKERISREKKDQVRLNHVYSHIYSYLWNLIYSIDGDRIEILQPHPEKNRQYVSVSFEVLHPSRDVSTQKDNFQYRSMAEWGDVISLWIENEFLAYPDINDMKTRKLFSEAYRRGCKSSFFYRITDNDSGYWLGTLVVDYSHIVQNDIDLVNGEMKKFSLLIADILPEYQPTEDQNYGRQ